MTILEAQLMWGRNNGAVRSATLRADGGAFELFVQTSSGEQKLVKTRKVNGVHEARRFANPREALALLFEAGIHQVRIDLSQWRLEDKVSARSRPDRAAHLTETHAYAKQMRQQAKNGEIQAASQHETPPVSPKTGQSAAIEAAATFSSSANRIDGDVGSSKTDRHDVGIKTTDGRTIRMDVRRRSIKSN